jgi:hypothetical protein
MIEKPKVISFDTRAQAWTDGTHFVAGTIIRRYAIANLGRRDTRGRLARAEISAYFLDTYGVNADVR